MNAFRGLTYAALTAVLLWAAIFAGACAATRADAYPAAPTTCHELYWLTLTTGSPEPHRYPLVLADGETRCDPVWWVRVVWHLGGRR